MRLLTHIANIITSNSVVSSLRRAYYSASCMDAVELQELFSTNLKNARKNAHLSQMGLAEKANLSVGYICDLESGRRWGTPETFSKLSQALEIHPFQLLLPVKITGALPEHADLSIQCEFIAKFHSILQSNITQAVDKAISDTFLTIV